MSNLIFPTLKGMKPEITKTPIHNTLRQKSPLTGKEVRAQLRAYPLYKFKIGFNYLLDKENDMSSDLRTLMGFYNRVGGSFDNFLFRDPSDYNVNNQFIANGDGVTNKYYLSRTLGGFTEPIYGSLSNEIRIKSNGQLLSPSSYTLTTDAILTLNNPAALNGYKLSWEGSFYYRVIFDEDSNDFEMMFRGLWDLSSIVLLTDRS